LLPVSAWVGGQIAANALAAGFYPTSIRATASLGARHRPGRLDHRALWVGGALLTAKWSTASVFMAAAGAAFLRGAGGVFAEPARRHGRKAARTPPISRYRLKAPCGPSTDGPEA